MEPLSWGPIFGQIFLQFTPVWIALAVTYTVSIVFKRRLGLYGKLFDSPIGMVGFGLVMFWVFTAAFSDLIVTHDPLVQVSGMKNKSPGIPLSSGAEGFEYYLLGGDSLARDVFSRMVEGSKIVITIAPFATLFAFMVGITLGLPAGYFTGPAVRRETVGYYGLAIIFALIVIFVGASFGIVSAIVMAIALALFFWLLTMMQLDTVLSFMSNLILAFPVILLFYLLVTPEIVLTGLPTYMAMVLFLFPIIFLVLLINSRFFTQPMRRNVLVTGVVIIGGWLYLSLISQPGTQVVFLPEALDLFDISPGILIVFVSVVFVNSPTVFRIVRGLTLDIQTRDYVAAAQTRGEGSWYIMLWEILPNARGPLIVDFCLRIGYTTILLGTLGFFGLGLPPESPDWGTTINAGRRLLSAFPHPAIVPALALISLVLGLNLLADGLREESLRD